QAASAASSFLYNGSAKAIVIPMDSCHQDGAASGGTSAPSWCSNKASSSGLVVAYGLVYRLLQAGIPVYWSVNPSKTPVALGSTDHDSEVTTDVDLWVLDAAVASPPGDAGGLTSITGAPPVKRMHGGFTSPTFAVDSSYTYSRKEFPIRGGAFLISASDRANFDRFVNRTAPYNAWANRSGCGNGGACFD